MESEKNLSAPDFASPANFANATATMNASVQGGPRWLRRVTLAFTLIIAAASLLGLIGKISEFGSLPRCDAQRTKDTLSDLNKQNKINASHYNAITTVNAGKDEVLCKASLALRDGGTLEYDFRIFRDESGTKVQITDSRRL
jgi:hypothetical protein